MMRLVLLLLLGVASSAATRAAADDVACLRDFKASVKDPLGYLSNWDFRGRDANICNFIGVKCVSPDVPEVVALDLAAAGLRGRFTSALLSKCSNLKEINLSNNFFSGRVPPTVCVRNRNLVTLDVTNNNGWGPLSPNLQQCLQSNRRLAADTKVSEMADESIEIWTKNDNQASS